MELKRNGLLTIDGIPKEHFAGLKPTPDLIDPVIVKCHPRRASLTLECTRFRTVPEIRGCHVLVHGVWVERPPPLH